MVTWAAKKVASRVKRSCSSGRGEARLVLCCHRLSFFAVHFSNLGGDGQEKVMSRGLRT